MNRKFRKTASLILLIAYLAPIGIFADNVVYYRFSDETQDSCDGAVTDFETTSGTSNGTISYTSGSINPYFDYSCGYSKMLLYYPDGTNSDAKINGISSFSWGSKFILEARVRFPALSSGDQIDLLKSVSSGYVHWYISSDRKMHLKLDDGTNSVSFVTGMAVAQVNEWTELHVLVDLSKSTLNQAIRVYIKTEGMLYGNYFGDASLGDATYTSDPTISSTQDGDMVVLNYNNLTIKNGATLKPSNRCKGMLVYVKGDLTLGDASSAGHISMTARGASVPDMSAVSSTGLKLGFYKSGSSQTLAANDLNGCGANAVEVAAKQPALVGNGVYVTVAKTGAGGADYVTATTSPCTGTDGNDGSNGSAGQSGGGGSGGANDIRSDLGYSGSGADGTCFSGGSGGAGGTKPVNQTAQNAATNGGRGGNGSSDAQRPSGGGAGNPAGTGANASTDYGTATGADGEAGTGGLLIVLVEGDINIVDGDISSDGSAGGDVYGCYGGAAGGGSGGGNIVIVHAGSFTNNGSTYVHATGGSGGMDNSTTTIWPTADGGDGGDGSIQIIGGVDTSSSFTFSPIQIENSDDYNTGISLSSSDSLELAKRSSTFALKTDFIKITGNASFDIDNFDTDTFESISNSDYYLAPNASDGIDVTPSNFMRRILNKGADFTNGVKNNNVTIIYDSEENRDKPFYGVFELNFNLDKTQYYTGSTVVADIKIKRPEDSTFKKIGQIETTMPASGDWTITYYWDSRTANADNGCDWTELDAMPYKSKGPIKFKIVVR